MLYQKYRPKLASGQDPEEYISWSTQGSSAPRDRQRRVRTISRVSSGEFGAAS